MSSTSIGHLQILLIGDATISHYVPALRVVESLTNEDLDTLEPFCVMRDEQRRGLYLGDVAGELK